MTIWEYFDGSVWPKFKFLEDDALLPCNEKNIHFTLA